VATVDFQGVPGQLVIVGSHEDQVRTVGNTVHADIHSGQLSLLPSKAPDGSGT